MSAQVLAFRQRPVKGLQKRGPDHDRLYFCTTCKSHDFKLDLEGSVWCAHCLGHINNLRVR